MTGDAFPVVVHVLMLRGRGAAAELFLLRRAGTGFMDGCYVLPGGHQRVGEGVLEAARRECREETGVTAATLTPLCVLPYRGAVGQGVNFVFEAGDCSAEPRLAEPGASDHAAWFPAGGLPSPRAPWIDEVLALRARDGWFLELAGP